ncbi:MAG TPA: GGDEF domain-containing protein, partial [Chloroflexota bacterium]|nr:GGDEF domain-containing protein [Chloroflexota bacterium]
MVDRLLKQGLTQHRAGTVAQGIPVEERARLLAGTSLFAGLPPEDLLPLAEAAEVVTFQPGERIVNQGDPGESLYLVVDGRVEVLARINEDGVVTETVVAWMTVGDALGELSLLDGQPRSASCVAVNPVTCLCLGREPFLRAIEENWSLSHALHVVMAQRLRMADKLLAEHSRDPLTGLNNRRALADLYEREAQRVQRVARQHGSDGLHPLAVVFCDVNRFKQINDTYGHQVGDEVLRAIADVLTAASRATDLVARYGGDEFVMLLPDAGVHGAELVIHRIRERIAERPPGPVPFTVSLGYAIVDPEEPQGLDQLLSRADEAMYRDKEAAHAREAETNRS